MSRMCDLEPEIVRPRPHCHDRRRRILAATADRGGRGKCRVHAEDTIPSRHRGRRAFLQSHRRGFRRLDKPLRQT